LQLGSTARSVGRAFDDALAEAGGSLPVWLVLLNLKRRAVASQRELAETVGISEATLTIQLHGMEERGLVTRRRHPHNRRVQVVELTEAGAALFSRLRGAAGGFDARLRAGLTDDDVDALAALLDRLSENVARPCPGASYSKRASGSTGTARDAES
jgi:MarR family transcriptional regulator for hemolysin